jgi:hypothetical protein
MISHPRYNKAKEEELRLKLETVCPNQRLNNNYGSQFKRTSITKNSLCQSRFSLDDCTSHEIIQSPDLLKGINSDKNNIKKIISAMTLKEESVIEMIAYTKTKKNFGCDFP